MLKLIVFSLFTPFGVKRTEAMWKLLNVLINWYTSIKIMFSTLQKIRFWITTVPGKCKGTKNELTHKSYVTEVIYYFKLAWQRNRNQFFALYYARFHLPVSFFTTEHHIFNMFLCYCIYYTNNCIIYLFFKSYFQKSSKIMLLF